MSATVWKFHLAATDKQTIAMPADADLLHVAMQGDALYLWARVDDMKPPAVRHIRVAGTGHPLGEDSSAAHVGSVLMHGGSLVFHVFDCGENQEAEGE